MPKKIPTIKDIDTILNGYRFLYLQYRRREQNHAIAAAMKKTPREISKEMAISRYYARKSIEVAKDYARISLLPIEQAINILEDYIYDIYEEEEKNDQRINQKNVN